LRGSGPTRSREVQASFWPGPMPVRRRRAVLAPGERRDVRLVVGVGASTHDVASPSRSVWLAPSARPIRLGAAAAG
jgi:hypothetical protein